MTAEQGNSMKSNERMQLSIRKNKGKYSIEFKEPFFAQRFEIRNKHFELLKAELTTEAVRQAVKHTLERAAEGACTEYIPNRYPYMPGQDVIDKDSILSLEGEILENLGIKPK